MVKAKRKPFEEIIDSIKAYQKILNIGCGGCTSVCLAGGQKEVQELNSEIENQFKLEELSNSIEGFTVERQCNMKYLDQLSDIVQEFDCLLSMACGAGVQYLAERFPKKPVFPALNTVSIGVDRDIGMYEEKCRACGECVLAYTAGICPVTKCAKGLFNGPCGGTNNGMCEVSNSIECAWYEIYKRLKEQDRLDNILKIKAPMQWKNQIQRVTIQEPYKERMI